MTIDGIHLDPRKIPKHIAIIMDGNRRWAEQNSVSVSEGHQRGLKRVIEILDVCHQIGIYIVTLFSFSKENWKRSSNEIHDLMELFKYFFIEEFENLKKKKVKIIHSGLKEAFDKDIQIIIDTMVHETQDNDHSILNLAINYSGQSEIIEGIKALTHQVLANQFDLNSLTEDTFGQFLFHPELCDPDFLIRTSGEQRISNFLLWEIAYTELYFTDILWPEFTKNDFIMAILEYQKRERRFGGRLE